MKPCCIFLVLMSAATICADAAQAQPTVTKPAPEWKVGMIYILGNNITQDRVILQTMGLYPGQTFRPADLTTAVEKLRRLGIFDDKEESTRPTIEIINSPGDEGIFKDLLVRVKETQTGSFMIWGGFDANNRLMIRVELVERNFDPLKIPTSWADIQEGRAFRGAGQTFRWRLTLK